VLFGQSSVSPIASTDFNADIKWFDDTLNDSQKDAIRFALASREVSLIHGPPGTGKTHTLIELILQLHSRGQRLLVCGPSNISVDNLVERLAAAQYRYPTKPPSILRLGHPARLLPSVLKHSLEVLTRTSDAAAIVADIRSDLDAKQASIRKTRSGRERKAIYSEMRELRQEFRVREGRVVSDLMRTSDVVLATLHGAGGYQMKDQRFDVVLVDEASQALEAQCWVPILGSGASKVVLAGDHLQLPPTIKSLNVKVPKTTKTPAKSPEKDKDTVGATKDLKNLTVNSKSSKEGSSTLETTLFDRLLSLHGNSIKRMLTTQYRMHESIMAYPSAALYESKLIAAESVKKRLLKDIPTPSIKETEDTREPLVFWDTQGGDFPETLENDDEEQQSTDSSGSKPKTGGLLADSKVNENEASLVGMHVARLIDAGLPAEEIAVITPYNGQRALLAQSLPEKFPGIEIGSVDGFQGREKEAVVVSLVRSNEEGEVGFLGEKRRLNGKSSVCLRVTLAEIRNAAFKKDSSADFSRLQWL
jgi:DNA polymerase alpha-associated DNA helicase A